MFLNIKKNTTNDEIIDQSIFVAVQAISVYQTTKEFDFCGWLRNCFFFRPKIVNNRQQTTSFPDN